MIPVSTNGVSKLIQVLQKNPRPDFSDPRAVEWFQTLSLEKSHNPRDSASVLVLFDFDNEGNANVLLTKRTDHLKSHAGQVSFPGGKLSESDQNRLDYAALRELNEETGIAEDRVRILGQMVSFPTVTGNFIVTPFVAVTTQTISSLKIDPNEVAFAGWANTQNLWKNFEWETRSSHGVSLRHPVFYWNQEKVWGLTAWILHTILKELN